MIQSPLRQILRNGLTENFLKRGGGVSGVQTADTRYISDIDGIGKFLIDESCHLLHAGDHTFTGQLIGKISGDPVAERYMGGGFCAMGYSRNK